jgi:hypothetical protein
MGLRNLIGDISSIPEPFPDKVRRRRRSGWWRASVFVLLALLIAYVFHATERRLAWMVIPNYKYRPSLIEENPSLLVWILLLSAYLVMVLIAKFTPWYITIDRSWSSHFGFAGGRPPLTSLYQLTTARKARVVAWAQSTTDYPDASEREIVERTWQENAVVSATMSRQAWKWPGDTRVMQPCCSGKPERQDDMLRIIITQDLCAV